MVGVKLGFSRPDKVEVPNKLADQAGNLNFNFLFCT